MANPNYKVKISANPAEFVRGMKTARSSLKGFGSSVVSVRNAVIGLAGAGGFGLLVKSSLDSVDALAKTSDKLGIATEKLAGLRYAAELTGVSTNTMDMALQRMTRRLAEAAQGGGEAKAAIEQLGLDAQKLAAQSPDKSFREIATAMESVDQQSEKVRLAFKFFDSEGVALVNTLALGSKGLNDAAKEAEQFGISISRVDAAKIEKANDALAKVTLVSKGLSQQIAIGLSPHLESAADSFINMGKSAGGLDIIINDTVTESKNLFVSFFAAVDSGWLNIAESGEKASSIVEFAWDGAISQIESVWGSFVGTLADGFELVGLDDQANSMSNFSNALKSSSENLQPLGEQLDSITEKFDQQRQVVDQAAISVISLNNARSLLFNQDAVSAQNQLSSDDPESENSKIPGLLGLTDEQMEAELNLVSKQFDSLDKLEKQSAVRRLQIEKKVSNDIILMKMNVVSQAANLLNILAGDSKKAAIAIIAVEKGLAIAQTVMNTNVAAMRAYAELGPVAGPPAAASIKSLGAISIGLIAATGIAQAANVGGGGSSINSGYVPQNSLDPTQDIGNSLSPGSDINGGGSTSINLYYNPELLNDESVNDLAERLADHIENRDVILIRNGTRNADELKDQ